jgi:molybdenum cofactor cytidylyltransferase
MSHRPVVIVVAAGRGRRFAGPGHKLAQPLGASTVLGTTLAQVLASALPLVVVTNESLAGEAARTVARRDIVMLSPEEADRGMGHSIAAGVASRPQASGWLVLPADMPLVTPRTLVAVAAAISEHAIAYAQHHGRRGHPAGFAGGLYSELVGLVGDEGARRLLGRFPSHGVEVDDAGVLFDVDTETDLDAARALMPQRPMRRQPDDHEQGQGRRLGPYQPQSAGEAFGR